MWPHTFAKDGLHLCDLGVANFARLLSESTRTFCSIRPFEVLRRGAKPRKRMLLLSSMTVATHSFELSRRYSAPGALPA